MKRLHRLSRAQRIIVVIALGIVLYLVGVWLTSFGRPPDFGWVAYAPLSNAYNLPGEHLWVKLLIMISLTVVWAVLSILVMGSDQTPGDR